MRRSRLRTPGPAPRLLAAKLGTTHPSPPPRRCPLRTSLAPRSPSPLPPSWIAPQAPRVGRTELAWQVGLWAPYQLSPALGQIQESGSRSYWVLFTLIFEFLVPSLGAA